MAIGRKNIAGGNPSASIDWDWDGNVDLVSRFEVHDANQVELKLDYVIDPAARKTEYRTEAFVFLPKSLRVSRQTYTRDQFFSDTQAYIRFKTPRIPLRALADLSLSQSPLHRIHKVLDGAQGCRGERPTGELGQELRMFGCLVRANLRDTVHAVQLHLQSLDSDRVPKPGEVADVCSSIDLMLNDLAAVRREFRKLRPKLAGVRCPDWVKSFYKQADEFLSVTTETYATELLLLLDRYKLRSKKKLRELTERSWAQLIDIVEQEQAHRTTMGYVTSLSNTAGRETFVSQVSHLKKFITSILFLRLVPRREGLGAVQFGAGIAAATAMVFSLSAAFVSERVWGLNSLPFLCTLVVAYVFKDRIKDWLKTYFSYRVSRWMPDRSLAIMDSETDERVGRCSEALSYLDRRNVPEFVSRWRAFDEESAIAEGGPEAVLHYVKNVSIRGRRISNAHGRRRGINDIIRWNISTFMARMDDPEREVDYFDTERRELASAVCPKRYEINVVLVLTADDRQLSVERFKVIVDRNGIHSLAPVGLNPGAKPTERSHAKPTAATATG